MTRVEIADMTGISVPTVLKITSHFLELGILVEQGAGQTQLGRKPLVLSFNPRFAYTAVVDFQVDDVIYAIADVHGRTVYFESETMDADFRTYFEQRLEQRLEAHIAKSGVERTKIMGVGIALPGTVDSHNKIIFIAPHMGLDEKIEMAAPIKRLTDRLELPIYLENNMNAAAVGEYYAREARQISDMVFLTIDNGIGAGIILDGKLYKGSRFSAGEVGYMVFDPQFQSSKSRWGWLEEQLNPIPREQLADEQQRSNERKEWAEHVTSQVALCIANIAAILDIRIFVLCGKLIEPLGGDRFFDRLKARVARLCINETEIEKQLMTDSTVAGIAVMVRNEQLDNLVAN